MRGGYKNLIKQDETDGRIYSIFTVPQFAIGQRALFIQTDAGNVLWDCVSLLDYETIEFIKARGGLAAIAISHPHFYNTHLDWAHEFDCPVYLAADDQEWLNRQDLEKGRRLFEEETKQILPGVTMIKLGGHFPGSSVLHWNNNIVCALQPCFNNNPLLISSITDENMRSSLETLLEYLSYVSSHIPMYVVTYWKLTEAIVWT